VYYLEKLHSYFIIVIDMIIDSKMNKNEEDKSSEINAYEDTLNEELNKIEDLYEALKHLTKKVLLENDQRENKMDNQK
jgi:hypothetical protein